MLNNDNPLQPLKDIHLPAPVSLLPQAMGWYVLLVLLILLALATAYYGARWYLSYRRRRHALAELNRISQACLTQAPHSARQLSELVRKIILARFERAQVAGLKGEAWLLFLDEQAQTREFSQGVGRALICAPYQKQAQVDIRQLNPLIQKLIRRVL